MTFVDTSALYALLDRNEQNHRMASTLWTRLLDSAEPLITSNYILVESCALTQHRLGLDAVRSLQDDLAPALKVYWIDEATHLSVMAILLAARRRKLSLVDCSSFAIMRAVGCNTAFTFDQHFRDEGFKIAR